MIIQWVVIMEKINNENLVLEKLKEDIKNTSKKNIKIFAGHLPLSYVDNGPGKRKVEASGHIPELKGRRYYKKPSTIKREQRNKIEYGLELEKKGIVFPIKPKKLLKSRV